jgi:RNA polymerase sigma-70 factor (ECF subfamily)
MGWVIAASLVEKSFVSDPPPTPDGPPIEIPVDAVSDHSLLRRFRSGNQDAATALYVRYAKRLQALARAQTGHELATRFDPEDVVQSVFRTFFRRAVDSGYAVPPGEELWQLLLVLALNKIRSLAAFHRAQKRDVGRTRGTHESDRWDPMATVGDELAYQTMQMLVGELISSLPPPQDQIVRLRIEGYEVQQISDAVSRSKRTVERTLQQFRERLAKLIDIEV